MGPTEQQITYAFAYLTYAFLVGGALFGVMRFVLAIPNIPKLAEPNRYPEITGPLIVSRLVSGLMFIAINVVNISLALQIGITEEYVYDATNLLSYIKTTSPQNSSELSLSLLMGSMFRMNGTIALIAAANAVGDCGHKDENIRKRSRKRVGMGLFVGVVLWTPEFWTEVFGEYYEPLEHLSTLLKLASFSG